MYCTTCGTPTIEGAGYCARCGTRLSLVPTPITSSDMSPPAPSDPVTAVPPVSAMPVPAASGAYPPGYGPPPGAHVTSSADVTYDAVLNLPLAPWWKRLLAMLLDGAILSAGYFVVLAMVGVIVSASHSGSTTTSQQSGSGQVLAGFIILWVVATIPNSLYFGLMNGSRRGQTVGKMALGIAVRDARTGQAIGFWRAVGRTLMTGVFELLLYVPFIVDSLAPLWDRRRQAWHDKVARSIVIDLKP